MSSLSKDQYVCLHYALLEAFTMNETLISKDKFSEVWSDIQSSKLPIEQRRIYKEFKVTLHNYVQYKLYLAGHSHFHQYKGECIALENRDLWV